MTEFVTACLWVVVFMLGLWVGIQSEYCDVPQSVVIAECEGELLVMDAKHSICETELEHLDGVAYRNVALEDACAADKSQLDLLDNYIYVIVFLSCMVFLLLGFVMGLREGWWK